MEVRAILPGVKPALEPRPERPELACATSAWGDRVVERPRAYALGGSSTVRRPSPLVELRARARLTAGAVLGERDLSGLLARIDEVRHLTHVDVRELGEVGGHELHAIHFGSLSAPKLRVLVTAGVHGNEFSGPAAAAMLMDQLLAHPELRERVDITIVPCINPVGFLANTRSNGDGYDLNRYFSDRINVPVEVALTRRLMSHNDFDLVLDLHSASSVRQGFFTVHRNARGLLASAMARFTRDHAVFRQDHDNYIYEAPGVYHSRNHHTLKDYAVDRAGARAAITLEAPGSFSYVQRVTGLNDLVLDIVASAEADPAAVNCAPAQLV